MFLFLPCVWGGKIPRIELGVSIAAWFTFSNVEVHKVGFLSGIVPSLLLQYIISISLLQVANLVGELTVI